MDGFFILLLLGDWSISSGTFQLHRLHLYHVNLCLQFLVHTTGFTQTVMKGLCHGQMSVNDMHCGVAKENSLFRAVNAKLVGLVHIVLRVVLRRNVCLLRCRAESLKVSEQSKPCSRITYTK